MGRPRKNALVGDNAIPIMIGSSDSPKARAAIVKSGSLRRSGRLKSRSLLMIEPNREKLQNPVPQEETLSNLEPNKEILPNLVPNEESLSNLVPNNERLFTPVPNDESNPVADNEMTVEETDIAPSEHEDIAPSEQEKNTPDMLLTARIESKIDFLVESVKEFKQEGVKRASPGETTPTQELSYKNMYFESQRKIQEMEEEIRELSKDFEVAQTKVEMLQQINVSLQNLNNVSLVSNFGKATEAIVSLAAQGKLNVPEEGGTNPALPQAQIVAAGQNKEASPPGRRNPKRTR